MCYPVLFLQISISEAGFRFTIMSVSFEVEIGINEPDGPSKIVNGPGGGKSRLVSSVGVSPSSLPQCPGPLQGCFSMAPVASFGWAPQSCKADLKIANFVVSLGAFAPTKTQQVPLSPGVCPPAAAIWAMSWWHFGFVVDAACVMLRVT